MYYVWLILGNLWMLPNTVISALYLGVLALFGQVRYDTIGKWAVYLSVVEGTRLWRYMGRNHWAGWASGVFVTTTINESAARYEATIRHESRHVQQQMIYGIAQPILYILIAVFIWAILRDYHPYLDHPMERDARRYAGQQVDIPKSAWENDPRGRWYWWILLVVAGVLTNGGPGGNIA